MKVCIFGAGAVGGHIAGRLASVESDDVELSILARGTQLEALRRDGLRVQTRNEILTSHPRVSDNPRELGPQDIVIVAVKTPSLPSIAEPVSQMLHDDSLVPFVLNGFPWWYFHAHGGELDGKRLERLDTDGALWSQIGPDRAVGAVAYTACTVVSPGVVKAENLKNRLILGRPDGVADHRLDRLAQILSPSGLDTSVTPTIRDAVWKKLLMNLVGGSLAVLTASPMGEVLSTPAGYGLAERMATQAAAVATALGCDLGDPTAGLQNLSKSTHLQSIAQDLLAGRPMEVEAMFRAPLELAENTGVDVPDLQLILGLAMQRARAAGLYAG